MHDNSLAQLNKGSIKITWGKNGWQ